ncbi:MAG: hypothetical protein ACFB0C_16805 [Leptolyngbyaceae cyanobacterium]
MPTSPTLLTASTLAISFGLATVAQAEDPIALSFELDPSPHSAPQASPTAPIASVPETALPLTIPREAAQPPLGSTQSAPASERAYGGVDALALAATEDDVPPLPPAPQLAASLPSWATEQTPDIIPLALPEPVDIAIQFDLAHATELQASQPIDATIGTTVDTALDLDPLFAGGADSLVARAVGSAEGTRTPEGQRTPAYFGHVDPGNAAWNLGSFSYQHGAISPEAADQKQLQRLQSQAEQLQAKAAAHQIELSTPALLNGIDLANQAPMAALEQWGYIERLAQAQQSGLTDEEAIVWARTRAFIDPETQRWNAPGLGNTLEGISRDQTRRVQAISRALAAHTPPSSLTTPTARPAELSAEPPAEPIDDILLTFTPAVSPHVKAEGTSEPPSYGPNAHGSAKIMSATPAPPTPITGAVPTTQVLQPLSSQADNSEVIQPLPHSEADVNQP